MSFKKVLRLAIVTKWLLVIFYIGTFSWFEKKLPEVLQEYLRWEMEQSLTNFEWMVSIVTLILLISLFVSSIGLFFFRRWAKRLFIVSSVVLLLPSFFLGPLVDHAVSYSIDNLVSVILGFILAILFLSEKERSLVFK